MYIEGEEQKEAKQMTQKIKELGKELELFMADMKSGKIKLESREALVLKNLQYLPENDIKEILERSGNENIKAIWEAKKKNEEIKTLKTKVKADSINPLKEKVQVVEETENGEGEKVSEKEQEFDSFLSNLF